MLNPDRLELPLLPSQVDPEGVFVLPPAAVQEVHMKVQPWRVGSRFFYLNAVDVERQRLINSWLVCLNIHRPVLSKVVFLPPPSGFKPSLWRFYLVLV